MNVLPSPPLSPRAEAGGSSSVHPSSLPISDLSSLPPPGEPQSTASTAPSSSTKPLPGMVELDRTQHRKRSDTGTSSRHAVDGLMPDGRTAHPRRLSEESGDWRGAFLTSQGFDPHSFMCTQLHLTGPDPTSRTALTNTAPASLANSMEALSPRQIGPEPDGAGASATNKAAQSAVPSPPTPSDGRTTARHFADGTQ